jgi:hypothetical protein
MWPDAVDEILGGDQAVALAYVTPAQGVVLTPVTNFALRDRKAGTLAVNSSVGMWKKLERMQRNPHVAVAFHTRDHGISERPEFVLAQGRATIPPLHDPDAWLEGMGENWERLGGRLPHDVGPVWRWWLRVYHWRVNIQISIERLVVWPDLACHGAGAVHGAPLTTQTPATQRPPGRGTAPRIDHRRAVRRATRLPHLLLGWVGEDGFPVVVPVHVAGADDLGMLLEASEGRMPPGGRRAGLLAHSFSPQTTRSAPTQIHGLARGRAGGAPGRLRAAHGERLHTAAVEVRLQPRRRLCDPARAASRPAGGIPGLARPSGPPAR